MTMKRILPLLAVLATLVMLSGCAAPPMSTADRSRLKKVGVVSVAGDSLRGCFVSLTAFTNQNFDEAAPELVVDSFIEDECCRALRGRGGLVASPLPAARSEILNRAARSGLDKIFSGPPIDTGKLPGLIPEIARRHQLDALVVIWPSTFDDGPVHLRGITLNSSTFRSSEVFVTPLIRAGAYDGQDGRQLAVGSNYGISMDNNSISMPDGSHMAWRKSFAEYNATEKQAIRTEVHRRLGIIVPEMLKRMGF
jgi:hypothetical protein